MDEYKDIKEFYDELKKYREILINPEILKQSRGKKLLVGFPLVKESLSKRNSKEIREEIREILVRKSGYLKINIMKILKKEEKEIYVEQFGRTYEIWATGLASNPSSPIVITCLNNCIDVTNEALGILEKHGKEWEIELPEKQAQVKKQQINTNSETPKVFISHGHGEGALLKLEKFVRALGLEPIIVKDQPNADRGVGTKVNECLHQSDLVIVLATGDDEIKTKDETKRVFHPRQNVIHEIGLAQTVHPGKIIYLLEGKAEFPSNIKPKVYYKFERHSMDEAFTGIIRELQNWGFLKVAKGV